MISNICFITDLQINTLFTTLFLSIFHPKTTGRFFIRTYFNNPNEQKSIGLQKILRGNLRTDNKCSPKIMQNATKYGLKLFKAKSVSSFELNYFTSKLKASHHKMALTYVFKTRKNS